MRIWAFIAVLAIATILGVLVVHDPGYALFSYGNWTVEMPLWLTLLFIIILSILFMFFLFGINLMFGSHIRIQGWWSRRKLEASRKNTTRGLLELAEGHYKQAERYLTKGAENSDVPLINYLSAAEAADISGAPERRDHYLSLAEDLGEVAEVPVKLTEARLKFEHGDFEASLKILQHLITEHPKHPEVLRLLAVNYEALNQWQALYMLLPKLRKVRVFPTQEAQEQFEQKLYLALLPEVSTQGPKALMQFWKSAPASVKNDIGCIKAYARLLMHHDLHSDAESLLRTHLNRKWQDELGYLYGIVVGPSPKKQLNYLETFIQKEPENAILFLSLGRISLRNQLWGKARDYLEHSLALKPMAETYSLLGELMDKLGQPEKRNEYYRKGLVKATQKDQEIS